MTTCPSCGEENPERAKFCLECGAALEQARRAVAEERKIVTVLFCDLVGFTARSDAADPEDVRARLRPYHARLRSEIERFGGTVEKFIGDAVMAVFGAPVAHEDDPERAVRAGLRILAAIADLNEQEPGLELQVRIGVNTGEAVIALGARPEQGEGIATGDVVNTAARLQATAPVGALVIGEATYRQTREIFVYEPLDPVEVKGKEEPLVRHRVLSARARFGEDLTRAPGTPLVGREHDLAVLQATYGKAVRESSVQLVTVVGEPGLGKSRLVAELFAFVDSQPEIVSWRQGRCLPYGEGISFWALGEIVKAQTGILESDSPEQASTKLEAGLPAEEEDREWLKARLGPLIGIDAGVAAAREESFTAWRRFLEAIATPRPGVFVFEDLHWAEEPLLAFSSMSSSGPKGCRCSSCAPHGPSCTSARRTGSRARATRSGSDSRPSPRPIRPGSSPSSWIRRCCRRMCKRWCSSAPAATRSTPRSSCACSRTASWSCARAARCSCAKARRSRFRTVCRR
jgi:class 3 adenylate cyclase